MTTNTPSESNILIVDDNPTNLKVLFSYLKQFGFRTFIAKSGVDAIEQIHRLPPDLILLDIMMPGIDGFETCRRLKADERTKNIPIIFITALSDTTDKVKGFEAGGIDYITKPFHQEEVLARVNAHLTIQRQKQELHALNATKDKFFSIIAHDLRGTFGGLLGLSDLLATTTDDFDQEQISQIAYKMHGAVTNTYKLLENLLEWARLQKGIMEFEPKPFNLYDSAQTAINLYMSSAKQKEITLTNQVEPSHSFIYGDSNMVNTVIRNLVANALKFTHRAGCVTISAQGRDDFVETAITDSGIGIDPDIQAKLFRIDTKVKQIGTANERGTGLGLILCKELIEKNGGEIWVESKVGQGSTFKFTLPKWNNQS
ncbi:MAG: hybrid sensor histidine kinase/response regulator [Anaerolineales bacterium]|nr:hybrid sensor histidine kinase/response regulator [Anaerolineales bacterium]